MVGFWTVTVTSEYVDPKGTYQKFEESFQLEIYDEGEDQEADESEITDSEIESQLNQAE